jgi:hypothetical protein
VAQRPRERGARIDRARIAALSAMDEEIVRMKRERIEARLNLVAQLPRVKIRAR